MSEMRPLTFANGSPLSPVLRTADAIRAARAEERKKARREVQDAKEVTYKVLKADSGPWKVWKTVTEKVDGGMTREEMLERRAREKADRHCK